MGFNETTATASSGILLTKAGVFFEQEVSNNPADRAVSINNFFIGFGLSSEFGFIKDTTNNHLTGSFSSQYNQATLSIIKQRSCRAVIVLRKCCHCPLK
jgi:hypothetical protein